MIGIASPFNRGRYFLERYSKLIFLAAVVIIFSLGSYYSLKQYTVWLGDPLTKLLLPPHQDIGYFAFYSLTRFFAPYLISLVFALLILWVAVAANKKSGGIFFEKGEPYLAATSLFLVGHPGWLIYLVALISVYFILHTSYFILRREATRLPLYHLWVPTAFFVILINEYWLSSTYWWALLNF
ncbi:MAG: hypothetical protein Q8P66_02895 [Candidatus Colwellbacteria bacterium]|nr:hypothetical protein [Candidatus Colwellbacteria bacterium]